MPHLSISYLTPPTASLGTAPPPGTVPAMSSYDETDVRESADLAFALGMTVLANRLRARAELLRLLGPDELRRREAGCRCR